MAKTVEQLQDSALAGFKRVNRNADIVKGEPTFWEKEVERSSKMKKEVAPQPRVSFYNPNNPLNGSMTKSKEVVKEIQEKLKGETKKPRESKPSILILKALYGAIDTFIEMKNPAVGKKVNNRTAGADPVPGTKKTATITARLLDGTEVTKEFSEGEIISF